MIHRSDADIVKRLNVFASWAAIFSMVVGLSVLAGWTLDIAALITWGAGAPMAPNAAACFVLAGFSLWLLREKENRPSPAGRTLAAKASAALVSLAGLLSLTEHLLRRDIGIDRLLLLRPAGPEFASFRTLMSPLTAGSFLLFGLGLQGIDWRTKRHYWVAQFLCLPASIASAFPLLSLYWRPSISPITVPVPTGFAFLALTSGLLCSRATWAIGGLLTRQSRGARLLRAALPAALVVLGLLGWLISKPLLSEVHFTWVEVTLLAIVTGAMLAGFSREIRVTSRAQAQVKALNADLERRVEQRTAALAAEVAARQGAEAKLRSSEEMFRMLLDGITDYAVYMLDVEGRVVSWNSGAARIQGYSAEEIIGKHVSCFYSATDQERNCPQDSLREAAEAGRFEGEGWRVRKDGSAFWANAVITPVHQPDGSLSGYSKVVRDITVRKRGEDALRESEERLRLALEGGRLGTWQWKLESDELDGTPLSLALFGLPADKKLNFAGFRAALHPQDRVRVDESMRRCLAGEAEYDVEYRTIWPDGSERWAAARGQAYKNAGNEITHVRGVVSDITDRRQAQVALRESEERFQVMANGIQQLAWIAEADGSISWYNQRWYDYTGTTLEQTEGWTWEKIHDPAVLPAVLRGWKEAIANGTPFDMELPLRGADGSYRMFLTRVMPVRNAEGSVVRWLGTNTDISERKKAEEQLARLAVELGQQAEDLAQSRQDMEAQKLMLQSVLNSMVEGLVAADERGKFILWNPAADKIMGLGSTHLPSTDWAAHYGLFLPDTITPIPPGETPLERTLRGEAGTTEIFLRHAGLDRGVWLEATGSPLLDKDGVMRGAVLAFRDITRRKTDELEIRKLNEELEERIVKRTAQLETANHELEAFSYSVSHDLRAPLRHIDGFSRILMNDFGSVMAPEAKDHLQRINDAVIRMGMLVDGLLSLAKLGRQSLKLRPTDLNAIVAETISVLQPEWEGRGVEWRIAHLPALECDGVLMGQVFQNLLGNALKYSRGRTKAVIEVDSIQQAGKPVVVFVRDNGAGFNMQYAEKLFGVFQRMHTEAEFEGTGVGLATVQRIVQKHGGRIWAEAETDHGATFYFTLEGNRETKTVTRRGLKPNSLSELVRPD